ncbi:MAG: hypothetical protein ACOY5H_10635 [Pseudomonadota bacterium]
MPMSSVLRLATVLSFSLCVSSVWAGSDDTYRADRRQSDQMDRIEQGVRDGRLTKREAEELLTQQRHIENYEKHIKEDGRVTWRERAQLERKQDKANRRIVEENTDSQHR